ncbi:nitrilase-related carbon-nitrogen hydrolase [Paraburkholderia caballeronis]|uniref:nitrilase-related carbon-nitrogen hydrolase n=1 Tax=Paraburkholderia caballeronis TaxID=416943 RepID=UPI001065CD72|nr:nitrilase-related carbon-nitrogen hydrolase [Paraburkholderia caballeronis]
MRSSSPTPLRVASIPLAPRHGDPMHNAMLVASSLERAARAGVALAIFPERCLTGGDLANARTVRRGAPDTVVETSNGPAFRTVRDAVAQTGVAAGVGLIERAADGRLFNSYAICLPDGQRHWQRQALSRDGRHARHGGEIAAFDTHWGARIGVLIGRDNDLAENARTLALMDAHLLIAPHLTPSPHPRDDGWLPRVLAARALENGFYVAFCDSADSENPTRIANAATIVDPSGQPIGIERDDMQGLLAADVEPSRVAASAGRQRLAARRPELSGRAASPPAAREPQRAAARGSVPLSFAVVARTRIGR